MFGFEIKESLDSKSPSTLLLWERRSVEVGGVMVLRPRIHRNTLDLVNHTSWLTATVLSETFMFQLFSGAWGNSSTCPYFACPLQRF